MNNLNLSTMSQHQLATVFYKYKSFASGKLILYAAFAIGFFFIASGNTFLMVIWAVFLIVPPMIAAIRQKSFFSLRAWDDRKLTITPDYVQVGDVKYEFEGIETIAIYLGGFYGFGYGRRSRSNPNGIGRVNGDDTVLAFRYKGATQSYQFFLRDFDSYVAICHIIDEWKKSGKSFVLKEQFSRDYIREQIRLSQN